jgi:hypothetical protein
VSIQKGADGKPTGYTIEAAIPWTGYAKAANHPPQPNDVWRLNFYAMKNNAGVSWSPILGQGNFHKATRFGKITWVVPGAPIPDAGAAAAPSASAAAAASASGAAGAQAGGRIIPVSRPSIPMRLRPSGAPNP